MGLKGDEDNRQELGHGFLDTLLGLSYQGQLHINYRNTVFFFKSLRKITLLITKLSLSAPTCSLSLTPSLKTGLTCSKSFTSSWLYLFMFINPEPFVVVRGIFSEGFQTSCCEQVFPCRKEEYVALFYLDSFV